MFPKLFGKSVSFNFFLISLILVLSFVLRLINLNQSLWHDESGTVIAARDSRLLPLITQYSLADFHPPGYFVFLWGWVRIFGTGEISIRMPSIIFGFFTILLTFLIGRKLYNIRVGLLSSLFLAVSPLHIYYSQEARMYSFAAFAATLSIFSFLKLVSEEKWGRLLYFFSLVLVLYSDYLTYLILIVESLLILAYRRSAVKIFLAPFFLGAITIIPWLFIFPKQFINGKNTAFALPGWNDVVGQASLKSIEVLLAKFTVGRISFNNRLYYGSVVLGIMIIYFYLLAPLLKKMDYKKTLLLGWVFVPLVAGFVISFLIPVFAYFRFLFILPAICLLLGTAVNKIYSKTNPSLIYAKVIVFALFLVEFTFSLSYLIVPNNQREDWRSATYFVDQMTTEDTWVTFKDTKVLSGYEYYTRKGQVATAGLKYIPVRGIDDLTIPDSRITRVILFDYLTDITDPHEIFEENLINQKFILKEIKDFHGVGFVKIYQRS